VPGRRRLIGLTEVNSHTMSLHIVVNISCSRTRTQTHIASPPPSNERTPLL